MADDKKADDKKADFKSSDELKKDDAQKAEDVRQQEKPDAPLSVPQRAGAGVNVVPGEPESRGVPVGRDVMPGDPSASYTPAQQQVAQDRAFNPGAQPSQPDLAHMELVHNQRMAKVEQAVVMLMQVMDEIGPWASDIWHSTEARTRLMRAREHLMPHLAQEPDHYSVNHRSARAPLDLAPEFDNRPRDERVGPGPENFPHPNPSIMPRVPRQEDAAVAKADADKAQAAADKDKK